MVKSRRPAQRRLEEGILENDMGKVMVETMGGLGTLIDQIAMDMGHRLNERPVANCSQKTMVVGYPNC